MHLKLKGKFYNVVVSSTIFCEEERWLVKNLSLKDEDGKDENKAMDVRIY